MKKKITIITPTFNSASSILTNLNSILKQDYRNWEHIIIDNKSTDNTIDLIIKNSLEKKIKIISEKDSGIFDAINKGIKYSKGEIISILHSDDFYSNKKVLSSVVKSFEDNDVDIVYGNLIYVRKKNIKQVIRYWKSGNYYEGSFYKGWSPPHPSFFVKKKIHLKFGNYKTNFGNSSDFELMYRFLELRKIKSKFINKVLVNMMYGGKSNSSFSEILNQNIQILKILKIQNKILKILNFIVFKLLNRFKQFLR